MFMLQFYACLFRILNNALVMLWLGLCIKKEKKKKDEENVMVLLKIPLLHFAFLQPRCVPTCSCHLYNIHISFDFMSSHVHITN